MFFELNGDEIGRYKSWRRKRPLNKESILDLRFKFNELKSEWKYSVFTLVMRLRLTSFRIDADGSVPINQMNHAKALIICECSFLFVKRILHTSLLIFTIYRFGFMHTGIFSPQKPLDMIQIYTYFIPLWNFILRFSLLNLENHSNSTHLQ